MLFFPHRPDLKWQGLWWRQSTLALCIFCACPKSDISGLCMSCSVITFSIYFMLLEYIRGTLSLYLFIMMFWAAAACPLVWRFPRRSLETNGWASVDVFIPVGLLPLWHVHNTYSRYMKNTETWKSKYITKTWKHKTEAICIHNVANRMKYNYIFKQSIRKQNKKTGIVTCFRSVSLYCSSRVPSRIQVKEIR